MRIRTAREDDARVVVDLMRGLAGELDDKVRVNSGYVKKYLRSPGCHVMLALEKGVAVGLLSYSIRPGLYHASPSLYIEDLYVGKKFRRTGVAGKMIERALRSAKRMKCAEVSVSTGLWNRRAIRFYKKHGLRDRSLLLEGHVE